MKIQSKWEKNRNYPESKTLSNSVHTKNCPHTEVFNLLSVLSKIEVQENRHTGPVSGKSKP